MENNDAYLVVCSEKAERLNKKTLQLEKKIVYLEKHLKDKMSENQLLINLLESVNKYQNSINDILESCKEQQKYMEEYSKIIHHM